VKPSRHPDPWALLILAALAVFMLVALTGCAKPPRQDPAPLAELPAVEVPAVEVLDLDAARADVARARADVARARADLAFAEAREAAATRAAEQARLEGHRTLLAWATAIALLAALACVGLAWYLPVLRGRLLAAAGACAAVVVAAQVLSVALGWLPLVGAAVCVIALIGAAVALLVRLRAAVASVRVAIDKADPSWAAMRVHLLTAQGGEGSPVQRDLDRMAKKG
jgi:predicted small lipoprotein YifL